MRQLKRLLLGMLALMVLASMAAYFTPLDTYAPRVAQDLSAQLHEKVSIRHLKLAVLPLPHLELLDVRIGGQDGITMRTVDAQLDLPSLLIGELAVRRILIKDGVARLAQVKKLVGALAGAHTGSQGIAVRELQLSGIRLLAPGMTLEPIEGKLEFAQTGQLRRAWFALNKQKLTVTLLPQPNRHFALVMQARDWAYPQFPQLLLDDLQMEGMLGEQDFVVQKFFAASRGIRVAGSGKVEFSDGWHVQAELAQMEMPLERLAALSGKPFELTGVLSVKGKLSGGANTLEELKDGLQFSGDMLIGHATARFATNVKQPLAFDQARVHVVLQPDQLDLSGLEVKLYGGSLSGSAVIKRKDAMLIAEVSAKRIAMQSLVKALTNKVMFSGSMDSVARFSMPLGNFERFPQNLQISGNFHLRNGELSEVDIAQAAASYSTTSGQGGMTRFDDFTGLLDTDADGYHFSKIKIESGSLNAAGRVDINFASQLDGMLNAEVKGTASLISMPLVVSGTLDDPIIRPSKSALAGAAAGTALLGPGFGTAAGIKVGGFLNKLFGKSTAKDNGKDAAPAQPAKK